MSANTSVATPTPHEEDGYDEIPYVCGHGHDLPIPLEAGADAYLVKPIDPLELQGHLHAGLRIIALERELTDRVAELAATVKELNEAKAALQIPL